MPGLRCSLMRLDSGILAMAVQDETEIARSKTISISGNNHVKGDTQSEALVQSKCTSSSLKVRKPYTITKQREKWTEEEHQKFLEALRLYGRGWRQIEEHVGTKTAVQIRSHAQKFFSKLERESNGSFESSIQSIVIPPPRHKRKPLHPYPRKPVEYSNGRSNLDEKRRPPSPYLMVAERVTRSPTSVLSRVDSESYESAIPEQTVRSLSPSSFHTEMHSMSKSHIEKDNDYLTLKSSEEAKAYWLSVSHSGGASLENLFSLKFESDSDGTKSSKGTSANDQPATEIKLFGRTISISNVEKPLGVPVKDLNSVACMHSQGNHVVDKEKLGLELQSHPDIHLSLGMSCGNSNALRGGENMNSMEDQKEMLIGSVAEFSLPGWTFPQGLSTFNSGPSNKYEFPTPLHARLMERMDNRNGMKGSSFTGSSSRSICELRNCDKKLVIGDSENQELNNEASMGAEETSKSVGISPRKCTGGFVPYK